MRYGLFIAGLFLLGFSVLYAQEDRDKVNPVDRLFMMPYSATLGSVANVTKTLASTPYYLGFALYPARSPQFLVAHANSVLVSSSIIGGLKDAVSRKRPYCYFDGAPEDMIAAGDYLRSFPSGHTAAAFCSFGFTLYVFTNEYKDFPYRWPLIYGTGTLALGTGILRMASGHHFLSDVLAGACIGGISGYAVPWITYELFKQDIWLELSLNAVSVHFFW